MARHTQGRTTRLKTGDNVKVISGKHKGQTGKILSVDRKQNRVFIEKVNVIPQGGYREQEASIHASNVMIIDPKTGEPTRIGMEFLEDGRKVRISRKSGARLDDQE